MVSGVQAAEGRTAPTRIGDYVLRRWLAQGGMAELYLATPAEAGRGHDVVVVKQVLPQFAQDTNFMRMFAREAHLAAILKHPNIVDVIDDGHLEAEDPEACFFAMEYVHGADLSAVLRKLREQGATIPLANALFITMGICSGLHHAHQLPGEDGVPLGIIHRDVSPSNVMLSTEGEVKITDFGVAKALALTSFTQAGTRKGKLSYMSPEQAVADPVDCRTDVFAIGAVLYELTTMQRMFGGENELAVMHKLLFRERPRPSEVMANYPPELEAIVMKATAHDPNDRYPTAAALRQAIVDFAQRQGLVPSQEALGRFVRSVLQPPPHPAEDPSFFEGYDPNTPGPESEREGTVPELANRSPLTRPGGLALDVPTALDGAAPRSDPQAAAMSGSAPRAQQYTTPYPVVPQQAAPPPQAAAAGSLAAPVPAPPTPLGPSVAPSAPRRSNGVLLGFSVAATVVLVTVGGVLAYSRLQADDAAVPAQTTPQLEHRAPAVVPRSPDAAEADDAPTTVLPDAVEVAQPAPPDQAVDEPPTPLEPSETSERGKSKPTTSPEEEPKSAKSKSERRKSTRRRKKDDDSKSSGKSKSDKKAKKDRPPPPPPPDAGKKKPKPTDTLLPIVE